MLDLARILAAVTAVTAAGPVAVTAQAASLLGLRQLRQLQTELETRESPHESGPASLLLRAWSSLFSAVTAVTAVTASRGAVTAGPGCSVTAVTEPPEQAGATFRAWRIRFTNGDRCTAVHPFPVSADLARADALEQFGAGRVAGIEPT